ncbi:MAG TPA: type II secretion system protein [Deltaproteobacteria bacterium]|nr:type II secretion system protein [Deltaproteobacteria bacterium]
MIHLKQDRAFTLIELIVVISLISIMLVFSIPRFHVAVLSDPDRQASRWITETAQNLKQESVRHNRRFVMHIDISTNRGWVTHDRMSEEEVNAAQSEGFGFPEGAGIVDVEFPKKGKVSTGETEISFYKNGYSDKALVHVEFAGSGFKTYLIEPFLTKVKIYNTYSDFEN